MDLLVTWFTMLKLPGEFSRFVGGGGTDGWSGGAGGDGSGGGIGGGGGGGGGISFGTLMQLATAVKEKLSGMFATQVEVDRVGEDSGDNRMAIMDLKVRSSNAGLSYFTMTNSLILTKTYCLSNISYCRE